MAQAPKKKPQSMLDKMKSWVSPKSVAGKLSGRDAQIQKALKDAGAKAGSRSKTRNV